MCSKNTFILRPRLLPPSLSLLPASLSHPVLCCLGLIGEAGREVRWYGDEAMLITLAAVFDVSQVFVAGAPDAFDQGLDWMAFHRFNRTRTEM